MKYLYTILKYCGNILKFISNLLIDFAYRTLESIFIRDFRDAASMFTS